MVNAILKINVLLKFFQDNVNVFWFLFFQIDRFAWVFFLQILSIKYPTKMLGNVSTQWLLLSAHNLTDYSLLKTLVSKSLFI